MLDHNKILNKKEIYLQCVNRLLSTNKYAWNGRGFVMACVKVWGCVYHGSKGRIIRKA